MSEWLWDWSTSPYWVCSGACGKKNYDDSLDGPPGIHVHVHTTEALQMAMEHLRLYILNVHVTGAHTHTHTHTINVCGSVAIERGGVKKRVNRWGGAG